MSLSDQFPVEDFTSCVNSFILGLLEFLLLQLFIYSKTLHNFFLQFIIKSSPQSSLLNSDNCKDHDKDFEGSAKRVNRIEIEAVLRSLGMYGESKEAEAPQSIEVDEFLDVFEEQNPSLDEVKEAFDVFDENKDGFIDAGELQRILRALGLGEGSGVDECRRMISAFDENGDGVVDFNEFVKLMETVSC